MPRHRSPLEAAAGKLISAIQRESMAELGEPSAQISEQIMHSSHALLQAAKVGSIASVIGCSSVAEFLGESWVHEHPEVWPHIQILERIEAGMSAMSSKTESR